MLHPERQKIRKELRGLRLRRVFRVQDERVIRVPSNPAAGE